MQPVMRAQYHLNRLIPRHRRPPEPLFDLFACFPPALVAHKFDAFLNPDSRPRWPHDMYVQSIHSAQRTAAIYCGKDTLICDILLIGPLYQQVYDSAFSIHLVLVIVIRRISEIEWRN